MITVGSDRSGPAAPTNLRFRELKYVSDTVVQHYPSKEEIS